MNNKKNIIIEYYKTCKFEKIDNKKNIGNFLDIDITSLLKLLEKSDITKRYINYNGEKLILNNINFNNNTNLWELIFFRSRNTILPFIINNKGKTKEIELNDDESLSEAVCVLYDNNTKTLAIQRNIHAVGIKGIEDFFNNFLNEKIRLLTIINSKTKKNLFSKDKIVKRIELVVKNSYNRKISSNKNTKLTKAIEAALEMETSIVNLTFSVGNTKKIIDFKEDDFEFLNNLVENTDVTTLRLGLAPDEHSNMQTTDFLDCRIYDIITLEVQKGKSIDLILMLEKMTIKFKEKIIGGF